MFYPLIYKKPETGELIIKIRDIPEEVLFFKIPILSRIDITRYMSDNDDHESLEMVKRKLEITINGIFYELYIFIESEWSKRLAVNANATKDMLFRLNQSIIFQDYLKDKKNEK